MDIMETMHHMVDADVLLPAASGFSKAATKYSLGLVLSTASSRAKDAPLPHLPTPPRCTASTEERLQRVYNEPEHVDFQCCFGRWRNDTKHSSTSKGCISTCLAIGDEMRRRFPSRGRPAAGDDESEERMPIWNAPHASW
eukprot:518832-Prymnesium_polylepis.1